MRNKPILTILVVAILISVISCKKHNPPKSPKSIYKGSISAKVNGSEWKAMDSSIQSYYYKNSENHVLNGKQINISGYSADSKEIFISIFDYSSDLQNDSFAVKTYNYRTLPKDEAVLSYQDGSSTSYFPTDCQVKVTSIDPSQKIISGTFEFKSYASKDNYKDTIYVTEGIFKDIKYTIYREE